MQVTMQLKVAMDKAGKLKERLEELRATARKSATDSSRLLAKAKSDEERTQLREMNELARELVLDVNITNLLRAMVDFGMENLLNAPDHTLIGLLHSSKVHRGRPSNASRLGKEVG